MVDTSQSPAAKPKTRDKILIAAEHLFLTKGYEALTVSMVSEAANVGYGTVYSHFKLGKPALLNGVTERLCMEFEEAWQVEPYDEAANGPKTAAYIEAAFASEFQKIFAIVQRNAPILRVVREARRYAPAVDACWVKVEENTTGSIFRQLKRNQSLGLAIPLDTQQIAVFYTMLVWHQVWHVLLDDEEADIPALIDTFISFYMWGMYSSDGHARYRAKPPRKEET